MLGWGVVFVWLLGAALISKILVFWLVSRMLFPDEPPMTMMHSWWLTGLAVTGGVGLALLWPIFCIPLFLKHIHTVYV
jgi:hypothetical protein